MMLRLDSVEITGLVFVDLKKAFDAVDHKILCQKLQQRGVKNRELLWFKSYLGNRRQFCKVNGIDCKIETIETGVPQGSYLGPLLFLLCINDVHHALNNSFIFMYADNRRQFCKVNGIDSKIETIKTGVPQGSYLGPLLFLLYINDVHHALNNSFIFMYADDTSLCSRSIDLALSGAPNEDFQRLNVWLRGNKFSMSVVKAKSLPIASNKKNFRKVVKSWH